MALNITGKKEEEENKRRRNQRINYQGKHKSNQSKNPEKKLGHMGVFDKDDKPVEDFENLHGRS